MKSLIDSNGTPCISIASNNQANFGTTVTVIVGKKEPNLKSSLKKPKGTIHILYKHLYSTKLNVNT